MAHTEGGADNSDETRWAALMASAQKGTEADYRQLLSELSVAIKHYLFSRIGQQHFIEDCVQESLIAIHQARHSYDPRRRFRPWLFAIVRHKAIDTLRRQRNQQQLARQQEVLQPEPQQHTDREIEDHITQGRLMARLTPEHREALTLTKFIGLSNAEAATRLSISESAVKVRVHRAIGNLTRLMEADI
jgi:RNA polymerase sigma-70 factor (ECF subfamily)